MINYKNLNNDNDKLNDLESDDNIKIIRNLDLVNREFDNSLLIKILYSIIIGLNFFILGVILSILFKSKKGILIGIVLALITGFLSFLYQYLTNRKNLIITSLLNFTPLIPSGMVYTTEKIIPRGFKEIIFFIIHIFTPFISPFITFFTGLLNYYPVKEGYILSIF